MAAIGSIRKHGIFLMAIIGIALLAFVMGDVSKLSDFFSDKYTMVKINGKKLDEEYRTRLEQNTALWKIFYEKSTLDETETYQVHDMTWNQLLEQTILEQQLKDLGLQFTQEMKEENVTNMIASLQTQQPNQLLHRLVEFLSRQASLEEAISFFSNIEEYKNNPQARELYAAYKAVERFDLYDKQRARYMALAQNSVAFSDEAAKFFAENNQSLLAQTLSVMPNAPQFSEIQVTVSDKEISDWFKKHKINYIVKNDSRDIDVAIFPIQPSPEDLAAIQDTAMNRAARLKAAASVEDYNISMMLGQLDSVYFKRSDIQIDTLAKLLFDRPIGSFIEPFEYENMVWYYGKTYGSAKRPDSVNVAFLVVDFKTDRNPNSLRTKAEAKATADSLRKLLHAGANIFALTPDYLGGRNAADTTMWVPEHGTNPQLYDSLLTRNLYMQDAPAAYVVWQVLERTTPVDKRLFAIYTEEIKPSDVTVKLIRSQAMQLQAESNSAEDLMANAAKSGIQVVQGKDVTSMASSISQLQNTREIVSWAYNVTTKIDDISDVYNINNSSLFAVAAIRDMKKKGTPKLETVRNTIEAELTAMKKVEAIQNSMVAQIDSGFTMQQIAEKYQLALMDSVKLTFGGETYQNRGVENVALGKIFGLPLQKPSVVAGKNSVYVVSIYEINEAGEPSPNFMMEKSILRNTVAGRNRNENTIIDGLKDKATILDQRHLFFSR
jgi:peptidyl-prolyl cis-trans isomerase D